MADGVNVSEGSGKLISAEEVTNLNGGAVTAQQVQRVGQAFITADGQAKDVATGAGAVSSAVQRVTVASDDPIIPLLTGIGANTDTLEPLIAATNTALAAINALLTTQAAYLDGVEGGLATVHTDLSTVHTDLGVVHTDLGTVHTDLAGVAAVLPAARGANGGLKMEGVAGGQAVPTSNQTLTDIGAGEYETVAASSAAQVIGSTGAAGDYLQGVLIVPATTSPGAVTIQDGAGSAITIFAGGASSVSNLVPFFVPLGIRAGTNWKVTTGANVSAMAVGNFT